MPALIQAYIRRNAARNRDTEQIGPFLATFARNSTNPYLNYAIPDADARPTLTPGGDAEERIYRRAGFHTIDEILFISRRVGTS